MTSTNATTTAVARVGPMGVRLDEFCRMTYRALVLQTGSYLPDAGMDREVVCHANVCGCRGMVWQLCGTPDDCLTVALLTDDQTPYVAGVSRAERVELFAAIETYAVTIDPYLLAHRGRGVQAG